jgi:hypothetical protein
LVILDYVNVNSIKKVLNNLTPGYDYTFEPYVITQDKYSLLHASDILENYVLKSILVRQ